MRLWCGRNRDRFAARERRGCFGAMRRDVTAACRWLVRCTSQPEAKARASRWSRVRQAEGRRRKSDLRTQPVIDAEARLGTRFARLGSLQNASPACAAVMAKLGSLSDVREPSRAWSRTRAPRAIGRRGDSRPKPKHAPPLPRHRYTSDGAAMPKPSRCYFTSSIAIFPPKRLRLTLSCLDSSFLVFSYALDVPKNSPSALTCRPQKRYNFIHFFGGTTCLKICRVSWRR